MTTYQEIIDGYRYCVELGEPVPMDDLVYQVLQQQDADEIIARLATDAPEFASACRNEIDLRTYHATAIYDPSYDEARDEAYRSRRG